MQKVEHGRRDWRAGKTGAILDNRLRVSLWDSDIRAKI